MSYNNHIAKFLKFYSMKRSLFMKRNLGIIISALMLALCVSGCGETEQAEEAVPKEKIKSADDLAGRKIGTQLGTTGFIFAQDIEGAKVEPFNKGSEAVRALKLGKIDAVLIDAETANIFVEGDDSLTILDEPFAVEEYSIAYPKDDDKIGRKVDAAITKLKEDGKLDEIKSHWIGENADEVSYVPNAEIEREGVIRVATNAEFPPYESFVGTDIVGIDIDMMNAICDELGMTLEIESMEFDAIIPSINSGEFDVGVAGISVTPEREKNVSFTQSYATTTQVIIVQK